MNDKTKEILIDLVDYYCRMGTKLDPGIGVLENVVQRASKALELDASTTTRQVRSSDIDPFALDVVGTCEPPPIKHENEM